MKDQKKTQCGCRKKPGKIRKEIEREDKKTKNGDEGKTKKYDYVNMRANILLTDVGIIFPIKGFPKVTTTLPSPFLDFLLWKNSV